MKMKKILLPGLTLIIGLAIGLGFTNLIPANKERVREALYTACVNGTHYAPEKSGDNFVCNRRSIDLTLAIIYGDSYMEPILPAREQYEADLVKYKRPQ